MEGRVYKHDESEEKLESAKRRARGEAVESDGGRSQFGQRGDRATDHHVHRCVAVIARQQVAHRLQQTMLNRLHLHWIV